MKSRIKAVRNSQPLAAFFLALAVTWLGLATPSFGASSQDPDVRDFEWSEETIELFSTLPVQDGGRVKPLDSYAGVRLLTMNGKRTLTAGKGWSKNAEGELEAADSEMLKPIPWMLDCLFFPEQARGYRVFRVQDSAILTLIDIEGRRKRDWYSYNELQPGIPALAEAASKASRIEPGDRNSLERQTLKLYSDLDSFLALISTLEPLRMEFSTGTTPAMERIYGPGSTTGFAGILENQDDLQVLRMQSLDPISEDARASQALIEEIKVALQIGERGAALMPPNTGAEDQEAWWSVGILMVETFEHGRDYSPQIAVVSGLESLIALRNDPAAFQTELEALHKEIVGQTVARGEYKHIEREVSLYKTDPFYRGQLVFGFAFLLFLAGLMVPKSKAMWHATIALSVIATCYLIFGITMRCIIRERPPVVTLYDTLTFITTVIALMSFFVEWLTRRRAALGTGILVGLIGMFMAGRYELKEIASVGDTMASVVAVLDTNFYLSIHVTTIAMGYAGGLFAAFLAHVWIFGRLFNIRRHDRELYKTLHKMTYGVICFSLLFSVFGTIMGGIWANDSWGRFWGWDPKENGALLICLWLLMTLHLRLGGYIRERGFAVMSVLTGVVVSISWWGVNLLNVGLHSYGFTSGVMMLLAGYWAIALIVVGLSGINYLMERSASASS